MGTTRLEAEYERLKEVNRQLNADYNRSLERLKSDCREIDELKAENRQLKNVCALLGDELRIARQDTINVLNKLKSKCHNYYPSIDHYCCSVKAVNLSDIDELIKEVEDAEDKS